MYIAKKGSFELIKKNTKVREYRSNSLKLKVLNSLHIVKSGMRFFLYVRLFSPVFFERNWRFFFFFFFAKSCFCTMFTILMARHKVLIIEVF